MCFICFYCIVSFITLLLFYIDSHCLNDSPFLWGVNLSGYIVSLVPIKLHSRM